MIFLKLVLNIIYMIRQKIGTCMHLSESIFYQTH